MDFNNNNLYKNLMHRDVIHKEDSLHLHLLFYKAGMIRHPIQGIIMEDIEILMSSTKQ
jgi:hypothetical protein